MADTYIKLGDSILDLSPGTVIALNKIFIDLESSNSRRFSFTNTLKLPLTENNLLALGLPNEIGSLSTIPYNAGICTIVVSGIDLMVSAVVSVRSVDTVINIVIYDRSKGFWDTLEGMGKLNEYDFGYYLEFESDSSTLISNRLNTDGIVTPVINHGRIYPLPKRTLENNSFTVELAPWENSDLAKQDWIYDGINDVVSVVLDASVTDESENLSNDTYKFFSGFKYRIQLSLNLTVTVGGAPTILIGVHHNAVSGDLFESVTYTSAGDKTFTFEILCDQDSEEIYIYAENNSGGLQSTVVSLTEIFITPSSVLDIKFPFYLPALYYHSIVKKVIEEAGFTYNFEFTDDQVDYFESLIINYGNTQYPDAFTGSRTVIAESVGQVININDNNEHNFLFTRVNQADAFGFYDSSTGVYDAGTLPYLFRSDDAGYVKFSIVITGTATFRIQLNDIDLFGLGYVDVSTNGTYSIALSTPATFEFTNGKYYDGGPTTHGFGGSQYFFIQRISGAGSAVVTVEEGTFDISVRSDYVTAGPVHLTSMGLPAMSCKDFIKDFILRTGSVFKEIDSEITFKSVQNIVSDKLNALNWTDKRINIGESISFVSDYAQNNYFIESEQEQTFVSDPAVVINNQGLKKNYTYFNSDLSKVRDYSINGVIIGSPIFFDEGTEVKTLIGGSTRVPDDVVNSGIRLLKLRRELASDPEVSYGGATQTTYFIATYAGLQDFVDLFYPWLSNAATTYKYSERYYLLDPIDVISTNDFNLIYDDGFYFLPDKLSNYVENKPTKVGLLKVI